MVYYPCAKINLGLNVVARRADGYHELETVFCPVPLADELRVEAADAFSFRQEGLELDCAPADNLVVRAVRAYCEWAGLEGLPGLAMTLTKRVPSGAGLGGGSSDASMAVRAVREWLIGGGAGAANRLGADAGVRWGSDDELEGLMARIGADCPFFVRCRPVVATGIGDVMRPVRLSLSGWYVVLVRPDVHVSTKEAYGLIRPARPSEFVGDIVMDGVETWQGRLVNDFEAPVIAAHPVIGEVRRELLDMGATYASMSGSGSAVYGLFRSAVAPTSAMVRERFVSRGMFGFVGKL